MNESSTPTKQENIVLTKRVQTRYGEMVVFSEDDLISASLTQYGEWAQHELDIFSKFINVGDHVADVGAYIGSHALAFSSFVGQQGVVYSFEPNKTTFSLLSKNAHNSKIDNIHAFNYALGDINSTNAVIIDDDKNHGASSIMFSSEVETSSQVSIKKFDEVEGIRKIDFIKVDVEGMELNVINGAKLWIERERPVIFTEVNNVNCSAGILSWAQQEGYTVLGLLTEAYDLWNYKQCSENVFGAAKETGFLLIPGEKIEDYSSIISELGLPVIESNDDIVLLLLHKPQYPYEVLARTISAKILGIDYESQLSLNYEQQISRIEKTFQETKVENDELQHVLVARTKELKEKESEAKTFRDVLSEKEAESAALRQALAAQVEELKEKESEAKTFRDVLSEKEAESAELRQALAARVEELKEKESEAKTFRDVLSEKEAESAALRQALAARVEELKEKESEAKTFRDVLSEKETESAELRQTLAMRITELKEKERVILADKQLISLMRGAFSWRLTKPLRAVRIIQKHGLSGLRQVLRNRKFVDVQWQIKKTRPFFDRDYYLRHYSDVAEAGIEPLEHYLRFGWKENRRPNATFDGEYYLDIHPDVAEANICPLLHFAVYGQKEKRQQNGGQQWRQIEREPVKVSTTKIAVILPVYRDVELTSSCIDAALPGIIALGARLVIINDKSPDAGMQVMLDDKCGAFPQTIELFNNEKNLGFVASVNKGLDSSTDADVVLLNSDVIVGENWLECLRDEAYSAEKIGTVTPLSNNTTISAFPNFLEENVLPFGFSIDEIHQSFLQSTLPNLTAPTGIGFCMYIRRDCINEVGKFDEDTFGRGYGEENDFCQRAIKKGWLNILTPNLYAYHEGGVSFGGDKQDLVNNALQKIDTLHPNYHDDVRTFIEADLLKPSRLIRLIELMRKSDLPVIMHVSHGLGGGVVQHIRELAEFISKDAISIMLIPLPDTNKVKLRLGYQESDNEIVFNLDTDTEAFLNITKSIPLSCIHYHHVMNVTDQVLTLARDLCIPYQFTVHDYYLLNGNPTLTNEEFIYPGNYSDDLHNPLYPLPQGMTAIDWRVKYSNFWTNAERVIFPSQAAKNIFEGYYPLDKATVVWHPEAKRDMQVPERGLEKKDKYRIGILGALSREKGADFLEEIATLAKKNKLTYEFVLIGFAYRKLKNVITTGEYQEEQLSTLIKEQDIDIIFFPARWPETYSYTLSYAIESGLPIIAPNIGAFSERLVNRKSSLLYEYLSDAKQLLTVVTTFSRFFQPHRIEAEPRLAKGDLCYPSSDDYFSYYNNWKSSSVNNSLDSVLDLLSEKNCSYYRDRAVHVAPLHRYARTIYYHPNLPWLRAYLPVPIATKIKNLLVRKNL